VRERGDEGIAATGYIDDIAGTGLTVIERLAQHRHLDAQIAVIDDDVRPDPVYQLAVTDNVSGPTGQCQEDVHGATAQRHGNSLALQESFADQQAKRPESQHLLTRHGRPVTHRQPLLEI